MCTPTQGVWQPAGCVSCELVCVCVSFVRVVIICPASTHNALVSSPSLTVVHLSTYIHRCLEVQVSEERVDLSNDMTWRQMIAVGVRRVVLARGELDKLEGPKYAARRAELRRKAGAAARARIGGRRWRRRRTRQTRATRQRRKRQEGERREGDDREGWHDP